MVGATEAPLVSALDDASDWYSVITQPYHDGDPRQLPFDELARSVKRVYEYLCSRLLQVSESGETLLMGVLEQFRH